MPTDNDLIEMKSDIKYIKDLLEHVRDDISPIKSDHSRMKGGFYVAVMLGGIILSGCSYFLHDRFNNTDAELLDLQEKVALLNNVDLKTK